MQALTFKTAKLVASWLCCQKHGNTGADNTVKKIEVGVGCS